LGRAVAGGENAKAERGRYGSAAGGVFFSSLVGAKRGGGSKNKNCLGFAVGHVATNTYFFSPHQGR